MMGMAVADVGTMKTRPRWKVWCKRLLIGLGVLILAMVGYTAWAFNQTRTCAVVAPGPTGKRIQTASIFANYFPGKGATRSPAVVVIGGYDGGLGSEAKRQALALQAAGFSALQVAYHCADTLPNKMTRLPLERFTAAIDWLKARPEVDPGRIGLVGYSKGAEAALALAVRRTDVRAVVVGMPSSVVWDGMSPLTMISGGLRSTWTERGRNVPSLPYGSWSHPRGGTYGVHANGLQKVDEHPVAVIPVERTEAPILLICGEADTVWPSCEMAEMVRARLLQKGKAAPSLLRYPGAGHGVFGPALRPGTAPARTWSTMGGTEAANMAARRDMLLDLYASDLEQSRIAVGSLCIASGVPNTTALRWISNLEREGLVTRQGDPYDGRRVWIDLTEAGREAMEAYFMSLPAQPSAI